MATTRRVLLSAYYPTENERERVFRYFRAVKQRVATNASEVKAFEVKQENLLGYMLFVEGLELNEESIKLMDAIRANDAFCYLHHEFDWRRGAESIHPVDEEGFRTDGTYPEFEPQWDVPAYLTARPRPAGWERRLYEESLKDKMGVL